MFSAVVFFLQLFWLFRNILLALFTRQMYFCHGLEWLWCQVYNWCFGFLVFLQWSQRACHRCRREPRTCQLLIGYLFISDYLLQIVHVIFLVLISMESQWFFEKLLWWKLVYFLVAFDEFVASGTRAGKHANIVVD